MQLSPLVSGHPGKKVFLVEDNDELRRSLHWLLEGVGYTVVSCSSAEEFLNQPALEGSGCLILDLCLPGMDGLALLSQMRRDDLRVIMMSAHGDAHTAKRAMQAGAWAFIEKPFDHDLLLEKVRVAIP